MHFFGNDTEDGGRKKLRHGSKADVLDVTLRGMIDPPTGNPYISAEIDCSNFDPEFTVALHQAINEAIARLEREHYILPRMIIGLSEGGHSIVAQIASTNERAVEDQIRKIIATVIKPGPLVKIHKILPEEHGRGRDHTNRFDKS